MDGTSSVGSGTQERSVELLEELLDVARAQRDLLEQMPHSSPVETPVNQLNRVNEPVPAPSKTELCRRWFEEHPEDLARTGRDLSENVKPMGVQISHVTWSKVKKEMT